MDWAKTRPGKFVKEHPFLCGAGYLTLLLGVVVTVFPLPSGNGERGLHVHWNSIGDNEGFLWVGNSGDVPLDLMVTFDHGQDNVIVSSQTTASIYEWRKWGYLVSGLDGEEILLFHVFGEGVWEVEHSDWPQDFIDHGVWGEDE